MPALQSVLSPSGTPQANLKSSDANVPQDETAISFGAVLEAQLGTAQTSETSDWAIAQTLTLEDLPQQEAAEDQALVAQAAIDMALFSLPVMVAPVQMGLGEAALTAQTAGDATAIARTNLFDYSSVPAGELLGATLTPLDSETSDASMPASFAAALQSLPVDDQLQSTLDRMSPGDVQPSAPHASMPGLMPQSAPRSEAVNTVQHTPTQLSLPVHDPRWGESFSQRVVWMAGSQIQAAEFHVEPPQLGPIEVRLSISNDQANLMFSAPHAVARDAIQTSLPRLQEMLMESGISLGNVSVGSHSPRDQNEQQARHGGGLTGSEGGSIDRVGATGEVNMRLRHGLGLVDYYA
jgi:flagellar hook-length control protein FliK